MKHHFSLTFRVNETKEVDVSQVATEMNGSDFHVEADPLNGTEFSVHFVREGDHAVDLLNIAKDQVLKAVPNAELLAMDMTDELPMMGVVDDITKVVIQACNVFNEPELAHMWLSKPQAELNGQIPKAIMVDAEGRTAVSKVLNTFKANSSDY